MTETAQHPVRQAPLALWRVAATFLNILYDLFGAPEDVAARHMFVRKTHALLNDWLNAGEALMRRLLLIEAAAYAKPQARSLARAKRQRVRRELSFSAEAPEAWRVSFRCMGGSGRRRSAPTHAGERLPARFRSAWPLAERYEALLRAFNDPAPYARRLAARLFAKPSRARQLLRAPPVPIRNLVGADDFAAAHAHAESVQGCFDSS